MAFKVRSWRTALMAGCAGVALGTAMPAAAAAEGPAREYAIESQDLDSALRAFAMTSGHDVVYDPALVRGRITAGVSGAVSDEAALRTLLQGTQLAFEQTASGGFVVRPPRFRVAQGAQGGASATVEALIVTAQKREEDIQDVPIAISAFSQADLERSQIAGGPDLFTQIPNFTFTKTNFTGYSIQIRGIGTQAISATTDPAVAVAFNNTPFVRNRFFEQEFYDLQRIEVLRGPQGTLYGRNATAGVVNIISQKPRFIFEAKASADVSNYNTTRIEGMINIPLVEDAVALRAAGAWTKRDGYATNEITGNPIDGRDLWSTRLSLRVTPNDRLDVNLIWEHFEEDDDRLRSGKQLCNKDTITHVGDNPVTLDQQLPNRAQSLGWSGVQGTFSQGCKRVSLYSPDAFQTPNGRMLPYYLPLSAIGLPAALSDPYLSAVQSRDLRVIESTVDPEYRAESDIVELQVSFDLTDNLTLASETAYSTDSLFSLQDFNRFNTAPGAWTPGPVTNRHRAFNLGALDENGVFCDPQLGCSDRLVMVDLSTAKSRQFSQEFRIGSDFDGPFNFSLGANFLRYDTEDKYYVFGSSLGLYAAAFQGQPQFPLPYVAGQTDNAYCLQNGMAFGDPDQVYSVAHCTYMDPNPIGSLNDLGHNYFLSKNPYKLISYAAFGEAYYNLTETLKITGGLRWTVDKKDAPRVPTWLLTSHSVGYPVAEVIEQEWREPTGRLAIDWKPDPAFTDETLLYGSYARGYKAGGANPPGFVRSYYASGSLQAALTESSATKPKTFDAEFVDAFELGAKNTLLDGRMTLNLAAFYYDYRDYQISEIVERSAFNRNFDAEVWGAEIEADWRPLENLKLGFKGGYQKTRIADGEQAIDLMDRTAGREDWIVVRPFPTQASSCVLPTALFTHEGTLSGVELVNAQNPVFDVVGLGGPGGGNPGGCEIAYVLGLDPVTFRPYVPNPVPTPSVPGTAELETLVYMNGPPGAQPNWPTGTYPGWNPFDASQGHNFGEGFFKDLGGNELPNAPNWTATITADYTVPLGSDWLATLHTDLHWQSESWWRIFNDHEYNKIDEYFTMNLAAIFTNEDAGWNIMAYVKNVTDNTAITGAFLLSDDTALVTNVFLTEPRLYGLRVTKNFTGGPLLGSFGARRDGPSPFTLELGGQVQRHDAPNEMLRPDFIDDFAPAIDPSRPQNDDLDWGDGREVRLTWRPDGRPWLVSLGARYGETNGGGRTMLMGERFEGCGLAAPCGHQPAQQFVVDNYGGSALYESEEHTVVDFMVGREFGLGGERLSASTLSAGLRYAKLASATDVSLYGTPDWFLAPEYLTKYPGQGLGSGIPARHHEHRGELSAARDFKGTGPALSWEASLPVIDWSDGGRVELDGSVSGGLLFGKQRAAGEGSERSAYYIAAMAVSAPPPASPPIESSFSFDRSKNVTVPTVGASLGLAYSVGGFKAGAGYRWERYFDAIDGGILEHQDHDRTIDGPYFKLSVGFGGS